MMYLRRLDDAYNNSFPKDHKAYDVIRNIRCVLRNKNQEQKTSMKMLNKIEAILIKMFDQRKVTKAVIKTIDLTSDDDEMVELGNTQDPTSPESSTVVSSETVSLSSIKDFTRSLNNESLSDKESSKTSSLPSDSQGISHSGDNLDISSLYLGSSDHCYLEKESTQEPTVELESNTTPGNLPNLQNDETFTETISSTTVPNLSSESTSQKAAKISSMSRRKSVPNVSSSAENSIAVYKIKHQLLRRPSIYAKPKETGIENRKIISVPYKKDPKPPCRDPRDDSIKLKGITEKIYVQSYLHIDLERKKELEMELEEKLAREAEEQAQSTKVSEASELSGTSRTKSRSKSVGTEASAESGVQVKRKRGRPLKNRQEASCPSKKKPFNKIVASGKDDLVPKAQKSFKRGRPSKKKTPNPVEYSSGSENSENVKDFVYDNVEQTVALLMRDSFENSNQTTTAGCNSPGNSSTIENMSNTFAANIGRRLIEEQFQETLPSVCDQNQNNSMSSCNQPPDQAFDENSFLNESNEVAEEDLLVEVTAKTTRIRKKSVYVRRRKRRNAIDDPPFIHLVIKEEPIDSPLESSNQP